MKEKIKSLQERKITDTQLIGIVLAKDWFGKDWWGNAKPSCIFLKEFVVCKWFDFHDGVNSHIEGKETIAICKEKEDAELIFNTKVEKYLGI
jgi:hypothetical protein